MSNLARDQPGAAGEDGKKRQRLKALCAPCRRRKIRCDRGLPCLACVRRNVPALLCVYTELLWVLVLSKEKQQQLEVVELRLRVAELQALLEKEMADVAGEEKYLEQQQKQLSGVADTSDPPVPPPSITLDMLQMDRPINMDRYVFTQIKPNRVLFFGPSAWRTNSHCDGSIHALLEPLYAGMKAQRRMFKQQFPRLSVPVPSLVAWRGVSIDELIAELEGSLPSYELLKERLDLFFNRVAPFYAFIDRDSVYAQFEAIVDKYPSVELSPGSQALPPLAGSVPSRFGTSNISPSVATNLGESAPPSSGMAALFALPTSRGTDGSHKALSDTSMSSLLQRLVRILGLPQPPPSGTVELRIRLTIAHTYMDFALLALILAIAACLCFSNLDVTMQYPWEAHTSTQVFILLAHLCLKYARLTEKLLFPALQTIALLRMIKKFDPYDGDGGDSLNGLLMLRLAMNMTILMGLDHPPGLVLMLVLVLEHPSYLPVAHRMLWRQLLFLDATQSMDVGVPLSLDILQYRILGGDTPVEQFRNEVLAIVAGVAQLLNSGNSAVLIVTLEEWTRHVDRFMYQHGLFDLMLDPVMDPVMVALRLLVAAQLIDILMALQFIIYLELGHQYNDLLMKYAFMAQSLYRELMMRPLLSDPLLVLLICFLPLKMALLRMCISVALLLLNPGISTKPVPEKPLAQYSTTDLAQLLYLQFLEILRSLAQLEHYQSTVRRFSRQEILEFGDGAYGGSNAEPLRKFYGGFILARYVTETLLMIRDKLGAQQTTPPPKPDEKPSALTTPAARTPAATLLPFMMADDLVPTPALHAETPGDVPLPPARGPFNKGA